MKTLEFKFWKYFIPIFGLFYLLLYGYITVIKKKYEDSLHEKIDNLHPFQYIGFILYSTIHIYSIAFLLVLILSLIGII